MEPEDLPLLFSPLDLHWYKNISDLQNLLDLKLSFFKDGLEDASNYLQLARLYLRRDNLEESNNFVQKAEKVQEGLSLVDKIQLFQLKGHLAFEKGKYLDQKVNYQNSLKIILDSGLDSIKKENEAGAKVLLGNSYINIASSLGPIALCLKEAKREYDESKLIAKKCADRLTEGIAIISESIADFYLKNIDVKDFYSTIKTNEEFFRSAPQNILQALKYWQAMSKFLYGDVDSALISIQSARDLNRDIGGLTARKQIDKIYNKIDKEIMLRKR